MPFKTRYNLKLKLLILVEAQLRKSLVQLRKNTFALITPIIQRVCI